MPVKAKRSFKQIFYRKSMDVNVLSNINFSIDEGEFIGYIGPNGAGKSTTIKLLTGILYPTDGSISVMGFDPHKDRYQYTYNIGVVFGQRSLLEYDIPVRDSFLLYKAIYELNEKVFAKRLAEFVDILQLEDLLHIPVRKLSLGQRMRCEIAASLLHRPKVIFLDEPTIGLDALSKAEIRGFLKRINEQEKVTIILTTHDMDDIEELCHRIIFINLGNIIYDGPLSELKSQYVHTKQVEIAYDKPVEIPEQYQDMLLSIDHGSKYVFNITYADAVNVVPDLLRLGSARDISIHEPRLEDIVKKIYSSQTPAS
ncbi:MAG: ATP-binding cassette domain-containing protein [Phycisphaerae bacterium]|nr:ATP-binding cassette domain-containing protein [Phycisphaerae bacterium]